MTATAFPLPAVNGAPSYSSADFQNLVYGLAVPRLSNKGLFSFVFNSFAWPGQNFDSGTYNLWDCLGVVNIPGGLTDRSVYTVRVNGGLSCSVPSDQTGSVWMVVTDPTRGQGTGAAGVALQFVKDSDPAPYGGVVAHFTNGTQDKNYVGDIYWSDAENCYAFASFSTALFYSSEFGWENGTRAVAFNTGWNSPARIVFNQGAWRPAEPVLLPWTSKLTDADDTVDVMAEGFFNGAGQLTGALLSVRWQNAGTFDPGAYQLVPLAEVPMLKGAQAWESVTEAASASPNLPYVTCQDGLISYGQHVSGVLDGGNLTNATLAVCVTFGFYDWVEA